MNSPLISTFRDLDGNDLSGNAGTISAATYGFRTANTGTQNNTALATAIAAAQAANKELILPPGTFLMNMHDLVGQAGYATIGAILIGAPTTIRGAGQDLTILKADGWIEPAYHGPVGGVGYVKDTVEDDGAAMFVTKSTVANANLTLSDMTLEGPPAGTSGGGVLGLTMDQTNVWGIHCNGGGTLTLDRVTMTMWCQDIKLNPSYPTYPGLGTIFKANDCYFRWRCVSILAGGEPGSGDRNDFTNCTWEFNDDAPTLLFSTEGGQSNGANHALYVANAASLSTLNCRFLKTGGISGFGWRHFSVSADADPEYSRSIGDYFGPGCEAAICTHKTYPSSISEATVVVAADKSGITSFGPCNITDTTIYGETGAVYGITNGSVPGARPNIRNTTIRGDFAYPIRSFQSNGGAWKLGPGLDIQCTSSTGGAGIAIDAGSVDIDGARIALSTGTAPLLITGGTVKISNTEIVDGPPNGIGMFISNTAAPIVVDFGPGNKWSTNDANVFISPATAVNTIKINGDASFYENTPGLGIGFAITSNLFVNLLSGNFKPRPGIGVYSYASNVLTLNWNYDTYLLNEASTPTISTINMAGSVSGGAVASDHNRIAGATTVKLYATQKFYLGPSGNINVNNQLVEAGTFVTLQWFPSLSKWCEVASSQSKYDAEINIKNYGAVGDGVADDTNALIAALEVANTLTAGTWESAGDDYLTYPTRNRKVVVVPPGLYKLTRSIPINYRGVGIVGLGAQGPTEPSEGRRAVFYADHNDDIIAVNATYNVNGFFLKDLYFQKRNAHIGNGHGISVAGTNYVFGMQFENVHLQWCDDGFNMVCQDLSDGTGAMADLVFKHCQLANNSGYGLRLRGHAAIGGIFNSSIVANGDGGILMGAKGFSISNTDFEGQENPVAITNGTASEALQIGPGNYFEGNPVTATPALIQLGLVNGFRVEANQFSGDSLCPRVFAGTCSNGWIDEQAHLIGCSNVTTRNGLVLPTAGTGTNELSYTYNPSRVEAPSNGTMTLPALNERGGGNHYFRASNGRILSGSLIQTGEVNTYRQLINGFTHVDPDNYVFFAFSVKYMDELPHGNPLVQLLGNIGAGVAILKSWGFYVNSDALKVGDNINYVVGFKNDLGADITSMSAYFYPYGNDSTPGLGARLSQVLQWQQTDEVVPNVDPLAIVSGLGTDSPTTGDWGVGDRVYLIPTGANSIGKVCTVGGAPGTWTSFGAVGGTDYVDVTSFGAKGDGTTDDTAAITAAIAAASSSGLKRVHFPPCSANYLVDGTALSGTGAAAFTTPNNFKFTGSAAGPIKAKGASQLGFDEIGYPSSDWVVFRIPIGGHDVTFDGVHFIGENGAADGTGFLKVEQSAFAFIEYEASTIGDNTRDNTIRNCSFRNSFGFSAHSPGVITNTKFIDNTVAWCANGVNLNAYKSILDNNDLFETEGFECAGENVSISGNTMTRIWGAGISLGGDTTPDTIHQGMIAEGNIIDLVYDGPGIFFSDAACGARAEGNSITRTYLGGITSDTTGVVSALNRGNTISNNTVVSAGGAPPDAYAGAIAYTLGERRTNDSSTWICRKAGTGGASGPTGTGRQVTGTTVWGRMNAGSGSPNRVGIGMSGSGEHHIVGNTILDFGFAGYDMPSAIYVGGADITCIGNKFKTSGTGDGIIVQSGTTVLARNNYKMNGGLTYNILSGTTMIGDTYVGRDATATMLSTHIYNESFLRFILQTDGKLTWSSGSAPADAILYRSGVGILKTDTSFYVGGNETVDGSVFWNMGSSAPGGTGATGSGATLSTTLYAVGNSSITLWGNKADAATAVGVISDTLIALSTSGAKIHSFRNAGVEKAFVDKDGAISSLIAGGSNAFSAVTNARWKIGGGTNDYLYSDGVNTVLVAGSLQVNSLLTTAGDIRPTSDNAMDFGTGVLRYRSFYQIGTHFHYAANNTDAIALQTAGARIHVGPGTTDYFRSDGATRITAAGNLDVLGNVFADSFKGGGASGTGSNFTTHIVFPSDVSGITNVSAAMSVYPRAAVDATDLLFNVLDGTPTSRFRVNASGTITATGNLNMDGSISGNNGSSAPWAIGTSGSGDTLGTYFYNTGNGWTWIAGNKSDSATAIAIVLDNQITLSTSGAKLLSIRNNTTEKAFFDKDGALSISGALTVKGSPTARTLYVSSTTVGNTAATTEDDLMTYTLPAGTLSANGMVVRVTAWGQLTTGTADSQLVKGYFGGVQVVGRSTASATVTNAAWRAEFEIIRTGSATEMGGSTYIFHPVAGDTIFAATTPVGTLTADTTGAIVIKFTGQRLVSSVADSVQQNFMLVELFA